MDKKELILQKASVLFAEKGYYGLGLSELLGRCEIPKGSFRHQWLHQSGKQGHKPLEYSNRDSREDTALAETSRHYHNDYKIKNGFCQKNRKISAHAVLDSADDHIDATPFGLSLGSSGITPMQMTVAFGVLANGGVYQAPIAVLGISDSEGRVVWDGHAHQDRRRVFSESTSYMIVDMLTDAVKSGTIANAVHSAYDTALRLRDCL